MHELHRGGKGAPFCKGGLTKLYNLSQALDRFFSGLGSSGTEKVATTTVSVQNGGRMCVRVVHAMYSTIHGTHTH